MIKKWSFIFFISLVILNVSLFPHRSHADASASMDGFIIEADRVEGVMGLPTVITGETSTQQNKLMLRLTFSKATIYGLTITKVLNTPMGPVTIQFKSTGPVELTNMAVDVTKIEFGGIYLPNQLGEIGMKNVRLVAHKQTADDAFLPALVASLTEQGVMVDTTGDTDKNLNTQADQFKKLLEGFKDGKLNLPLNELNKILNPGQTNNNQKSKDQSSKDQTDSKAADSSKTENDISQQKGASKDNEQPPANTNSNPNDKPGNDHSNPSGNVQDQKNPSSGSENQSGGADNTGVENPPANGSENNDKNTGSDNQNTTVGQPAPSEPSNGDSDSGTNDQPKHGGLLDLLKNLLP